MNKVLVLLLVLFLFQTLLFSQTNSLEDLDKCLIKIQVNNTNELILDSTGIIEEDYSLGTGFYISSDGLFLTAAHVIKDRNKDEEGSISCYDNNQKNNNFVPIIIFEDIEKDIALLQNVAFTSFGKQNKFYINIENYKTEQNIVDLAIYSFGYPNELHAYNKISSYSVGKVLEINKNLQGYKKLPDRKNVSLATTVVLSGCSGGIITDFSYSPIGLILGSILENNTRKTYYKSLYDVRKILKEYEIY